MTRWIPCREFVELLEDYLAGRLSGEALAEFKNHLSGCPPCAIDMRTNGEASRLGRPVTCRDFVESLDDFISAEAPPERLEALDGHLAGCVCCTIYTETYLQTILLGRGTLSWRRV